MKKGSLLVIAVLIFIPFLEAFALTDSEGVQVRLQVGEPVNTGPSSGGSSREGALEVEIKDIKALTDSVIITWQSNIAVMLELRWGKTVQVNDGVSSTTSYSKTGNISITGLESGQQFWIEAKFTTRQGQVDTQRFPVTTLPTIEVSTNLPANSFDAQLQNNEITLFWDVSRSDSEVRIVRSNIFIITDPYSGMVVYEGRGSDVSEDATQLVPGRYYYTLFQKGVDGEYSNGIVDAVLIPIKLDSNNGESVFENIPEFNSKIIDSPNFSIDTIDETVDMSFCEVQTDRVSNCTTSKIYEIQNETNLVIIINTDLLSKQDVALISIKNQDLVNESKQYLLRQDEDGRWKARLPEIGPGDYDFMIQFFDESGNLKYQDGGVLRSVERADDVPISTTSTAEYYDLGFGKISTFFLIIINLFLMCLLLYLVVKKDP